VGTQARGLVELARSGYIGGKRGQLLARDAFARKRE
jgi:hypothetical protein